MSRLVRALEPRRRRQVFTHSSWAPRRDASYERLEFLGDSALDVIVSEELMRRHPSVDEGDLSWMRQAVVARGACAAAADAAGLPDALVAAAPGPRREAARELADQPAVRAQLAEAVIGASWLDLGVEETRAAVLEAFAPPLEAAAPGARDPKTTLQERAARTGLAVAYELLSADGPPQRRVFTSRVLIGGAPAGEGTGTTKQGSEQEAAAAALATHPWDAA
ncbi:MAG: ribonuclease III family protein [Thermoleophilia bacterium]